METRKLKTMAEMAAEYQTTEEVFRNQIEKGNIFTKNNKPMFDGENFFPQHQDRVYSILGKPFEKENQNLLKYLPKYTYVNFAYTQKEFEYLVKELIGVFAKNFTGSIGFKENKKKEQL
jgi:hypothetical protein